eukprot:10968008-Lingulodinium_polyedra.AAC.1
MVPIAMRTVRVGGCNDISGCYTKYGEAYAILREPCVWGGGAADENGSPQPLSLRQPFSSSFRCSRS